MENFMIVKTIPVMMDQLKIVLNTQIKVHVVCVKMNFI